VALLTDLDSDDNAEQPKVALMTIHSAKGLEFPTVFVVGLEENIFPSPMCTDSLRALEEERRLLYVAITRAEKHCILTCAQNRFRYGRMEYDTPSRFIRDIDPSLMYVHSEKGSSMDADRGTSRLPWTQSSDPWSSRQSQNPHPVATQFRADPMPRAVPPRREEPKVDPFSGSFKQQLYQASGGRIGAPSTVPSGRYRPLSRATASASSAASSVPSGSLREGMTIEHQRFGVGTVVKVEGTGENEKATVDFRNVGTKQLLLKFAKFNVI
jgi:DNA helicase-2/ATP-dependent DNA helicase PcrA